MPRTVRDFMNHVLQASGAEIRKIEGTDIEWSDPGDFIDRSAQHQMFWHKLTVIGGRNIAEQPPDIVPDIDATVELSDEEWDELERESRRLM